MDKQNILKVKFWGVRGSYPAPGEQTVRYGGNTPCVEIQAGSNLIILDAGTGIIGLGRELLQRALQAGKAVRATLLFSHMHHDHTQGFPFFAPAFMPTTRLQIFGPHTFERQLEQVLAQNMIPPVFPVTLQDMSATKEIHSLGENQALLLAPGESEAVVTPASAAQGAGPDTVRVRLLRSLAHPGGVSVYRIEWRNRSVVYATDTEGYANIDRRLAAFAQGADLVIHDAQYTEAHYLGLLPGSRSTQGWGHSTVAMACDLAQAAGAGRLALFHFDPGCADRQIDEMEADARQRFPGAFAARDGQEVALPTHQPGRELQLERMQAVPAA